jgi:hypothetical protein
MKISMLFYMLAGVGFVLAGAVRAQYAPNLEASIGLISSVANSSTAPQALKDAAEQAAQTAKEVKDNKALVLDQRRDDKDTSDGGTIRMPKGAYAKGHEKAPERLEMVFINIKRLQWRYNRLIDGGLSPAKAQLVCDWICAFILVHECQHVNQGPGMTKADREKEAYTEEKKVEDGALSDPNLDEDVRDEIERFRNEAAVMIALIGLLNP